MTEKLPVAEYLRMSSEHQQYSLDNQHAVIDAYAQNKHFSIVKTYTDGAKTGVVIKGREALKQLLKDVMEDEPGFQAILVYDVTRWGRFQDSDEAAHYEFLCKQERIPVHYCAEPFLNDGGLQDGLMKALKRMMAGEYSRELGVKVLAGLKRLAGLGYKQGGVAGYGLRRMLLSEEGEPKQVLESGDRKSLAKQRVILIPGPEKEVAIVREIYRMFTEDGLNVHGIAVRLNRLGIPYGKYGRGPWTHYSVYQVLSHPKYTGCNVYGRTSQRLGTPSVPTPQAEWVVTPGAYAPIVSDEIHAKAKELLLNRTINKTDAEILDSLRQLLAKKGKLALHLIKNSPETPSPSTYRHRFGSLRQAYRLIGYGNPSDFGPIELRLRTQAIRENLLHEMEAASQNRLAIVRRSGRWRPYLKMKNGRFITILLARSIKTQPHIWLIDPLRRESRRVTVLALLNEMNDGIQEMRLFKCVPRTRRFHVKYGDLWLSSGIRIGNVLDLCDSISV